MNLYNHDAEVLEFIYDKHYASMLRLGLWKANYIALPGRACRRYSKYAKSICTASDNKAFFLDIDRENYMDMVNFRNSEIRTQKHLKKLTVLHRDIFHYDSDPEKIQTCRVEDIGIGERDSNSLMPKLLERLGRQSKFRKDLWKAQIIDMSKRGKGGVDTVVFKWLRYYFKMIDAELTSIDGLNYDTRIKNDKIFSRGEPIHTYPDPSGKTGTVFDHFLRFDTMGRVGFAKVYTYINGGPMINVMVMYK
jgi:hypothetical protein